MAKSMYGLMKKNKRYDTARFMKFKDISKNYNLKDFINFCIDNNILVIFEEGYDLKISKEIEMYLRLKGLDIKLMVDTTNLFLITINNTIVYNYLRYVNLNNNDIDMIVKDLWMLYKDIGWDKAYYDSTIYFCGESNDMECVLNKYNLEGYIVI